MSDSGEDFGDFEEADDVWVTGPEHTDVADVADVADVVVAAGSGAGAGGGTDVGELSSSRADEPTPAEPAPGKPDHGGVVSDGSDGINLKGQYNTTTLSPEQYERMVRDELGDGTAGRRPTTASSVPVSFAELESRYPEFLAAKK